ncbi:DNA integrity scanning diadenylate cyclase DisA [Georgenia sp. SUBG003]|uniref:DNA integrity scanning diadenylate cyclase DisA n=1 Tax=Georgenia sp. SUBG003 TaxID=1497974 RepID=UPI0004D37A24|nr:DNA integrity scanning protein DisA [Georgenia sp. SUBG003]
MPEVPADTKLRVMLQAIAPGTELRDGLERILRGRTGAIVVLGYDDDVEAMCSGGFHLDVEFSATRLRELSKMDGAVVVDYTNRRIRRANVQLLPDANIETSESGMRHRTAERAAKQSGYPVISVSQSMRTVALYVDHHRHVVEDSDVILSRANQALATLERYKARLDEVSGTLSALEIEDLVTVRDVVTVIQRLEMVSRISAEVEGYVTELGTDGRLLSLQLEELVIGLDPDRTLVIRDYLGNSVGRSPADVLEALSRLTSAQLVDMPTIARVIGVGGPDGDALDSALAPRGYRVLAKIPRLPTPVAESIVAHCGSLQVMLSASAEDLQSVDGVGPHRARAVREGLSRLAESSILERFA